MIFTGSWLLLITLTIWNVILYTQQVLPFPLETISSIYCRPIWCLVTFLSTKRNFDTTGSLVWFFKSLHMPSVCLVTDTSKPPGDNVRDESDEMYECAEPGTGSVDGVPTLEYLTKITKPDDIKGVIKTGRYYFYTTLKKYMWKNMEQKTNKQKLTKKERKIIQIHTSW